MAPVIVVDTLNDSSAAVAIAAVEVVGAGAESASAVGMTVTGGAALVFDGAVADVAAAAGAATSLMSSIDVMLVVAALVIACKMCEKCAATQCRL